MVGNCKVIALSIYMLLACTGVSRAGLITTTNINFSADSLPVAGDVRNGTTNAPHFTENDDLWLSGQLSIDMNRVSPADEFSVGMPPPPDSATLVLVALSGLGIWKISCSARKLRAVSFPEWFAAESPSQIGFVQRIEPEILAGRLTFSQSFIPSACLEYRPQVHGAQTGGQTGCHLRSRDRIHANISPRAPPFFSERLERSWKNAVR